MSKDKKLMRGVAEQLERHQKAYEAYAKVANKINLLSLQSRELELMAELERVQAQIAQFPAAPRQR